MESVDEQAEFECTDCRISKPRTEEFFYRNKNTKDGFLNQCRICTLKCQKEFRLKNRAKIAERQKKWRLENPDRIKETDKKYASTNKGKLSHSKARKKWVLNNPDKNRDSKKNWKSKNPINDVVYQANVKSRSLGLKDRISVSEWKSIRESWKNRCLNCGESDDISIDHVVPFCSGGRNIPENLQPLCLSCNDIKGKEGFDFRHPDELIRLT